MSPLSESDTRAKLIDPALHARGWAEDLIRREETAGAVELGDARPRRRPKGRADYTLRIKVDQAPPAPDRVSDPGRAAGALRASDGVQPGGPAGAAAADPLCRWRGGRPAL